jgi:TolB-like protein
VEVDAAALERELRGASVVALLEGLARWRGPLLAGFPPVEESFDDWLAAERTALARRALDAVVRALATGPENGAALALADAGLAIDAAFEEGYRTRMRILARRGDRAGALREHARCREALLREVGVEPSAATEALRREIAVDGMPAAMSGRRGPPTVAVAPFEILSPDASHELFARGLEEDVVAALSRFRHLHVLGPRIARREGGERAPDPDYLLAASVRASAGRLRVNTRLVDGRSGTDLWGERIEADLADAGCAACARCGSGRGRPT